MFCGCCVFCGSVWHLHCFMCKVMVWKICSWSHKKETKKCVAVFSFLNTIIWVENPSRLSYLKKATTHINELLNVSVKWIIFLKHNCVPVTGSFFLWKIFFSCDTNYLPLTGIFFPRTGIFFLDRNFFEAGFHALWQTFFSVAGIFFPAETFSFCDKDLIPP